MAHQMRELTQEELSFVAGGGGTVTASGGYQDGPQIGSGSNDGPQIGSGTKEGPMLGSGG